jgi:hypothetical protein
MPPGASITFRRKKDGKVYVAEPNGRPLSEKDADAVLPANHVFNARELAREFLLHPEDSMFEVIIRVRAENAEVLYKLVGFGDLDPDNPDDDRQNLNNWMVQRVRMAKKEAKRG